MNESNVAEVLSRIGEDNVVLDVGGWGRPFNRADYVLDAEPYETRGPDRAELPAQGGPVERFTRETWIRRDVCAREPYPFADGEIDFVVCSQTLEDVRDPLWVCSEMVRVAKRGYVEVPTRENESSRGLFAGIVGFPHHRWLIDIAGDELVFTMKYHLIHGDRRLSLPASYRRRYVDREQDQWLFWEGAFRFRERTIHGRRGIEEELARFVAARQRYGGGTDGGSVSSR
jgi:hypothetical protein